MELGFPRLGSKVCRLSCVRCAAHLPLIEVRGTAGNHNHSETTSTGVRGLPGRDVLQRASCLGRRVAVERRAQVPPSTPRSAARQCQVKDRSQQGRNERRKSDWRRPGTVCKWFWRLRTEARPVTHVIIICTTFLQMLTRL